MFKAYTDKGPISCFMIEVSPDLLRQLANRIEKRAECCYAGQTIILSLTENISIFHTVGKGGVLDKVSQD